jgi:hypothetical protein
MDKETIDPFEPCPVLPSKGVVEDIFEKCAEDSETSPVVSLLRVKICDGHVLEIVVTGPNAEDFSIDHDAVIKTCDAVCEAANRGG